MGLSLLAAASAFVGVGAASPPGLRKIDGPESAPIFVGAPESTSSAEPATTMVVLHGMCSDPEATCAAFEGEAERAGSFLVCPTGNGHCRGWADWEGTGEDKARFLDGVGAALHAAYGEAVTETGGVLVGFSRGAYVARDVVYARPSRYRALVLIGATVRPDAARFRASGIERVVLASGHDDGARREMERDAKRLSAEGLPARFVDLGAYPHALPADAGRLLAPALAWARGGA
jgi:predicted esterase